MIGSVDRLWGSVDGIRASAVVVVSDPIVDRVCGPVDGTRCPVVDDVSDMIG